MRGVTGEDMTPGLFSRVSREAVKLLWSPGCSVAVGRDTRPGASMLACSAMAGAMEAGADVYDAGVIPTPGLTHAVKAVGLDGGLMITGSHTAPDRTGLMVMHSDGAYITDEEARALEAELDGDGVGDYDGDGVGDDTPAPAYGTSYSIHGARDEYRRWLLEVIDLGKVREKGLSVGVDAGCATAAGLVSDALRGAWCRVHALNDEPGPDPGRGPEPRESSLTALSELVVEKGLDMGVAFDADADRVSFIDERGRYVSEDAAGAILGAHVLPGKGGVMVTPVNSSGMAGHLAQSRSADLYHCRIGQPAISSEVKARGAHFAYEESGKYFFTNHTLAADGPLACFMMLEALATTGESLSALVEHLPVFHQVKHNLTLPGEGLDVFMETISSRWNEWEPYSGMTRDVTDGLKLTLGDGSWLLIRPSGTEPLLRIYSDSQDRSIAQELVEKGEEFVGGFLTG